MKIKKYKEKYSKKIKRKPNVLKKEDFGWIFVVSISAFWISLAFSLFSEMVIPSINFIFAGFITLFFIALGILFDMIGISVTVADIRTFNSMASKKIKGAKLASKLIKNNEKTSSFCNDVIGDICGIISGSTAVTISNAIATNLDLNILFVTLIVTALVASLTIGGKAMGKSAAINNSTKILYYFSKVLVIFTKE